MEPVLDVVLGYYIDTIQDALELQLRWKLKALLWMRSRLPSSCQNGFLVAPKLRPTVSGIPIIKLTFGDISLLIVCWSTHFALNNWLNSHEIALLFRIFPTIQCSEQPYFCTEAYLFKAQPVFLVVSPELDAGDASSERSLPSSSFLNVIHHMSGIGIRWLRILSGRNSW